MANVFKAVFSSNKIFLIALFFLITPILLIEYEVLKYTKGIFSYVLDDTFILMAIAKNLVLHNVWGTSGYEFASASSSILYPLILAFLFKILGFKLWIPLIFNLLVAILFVFYLQKWLKKQNVSSNGQLIIIFLTIIVTPLFLTVSLGMEHTLQVLFSFLFITAFCENYINNKIPNGSIEKLQVYIYGILGCAIRFEGIFLISIACLFLLSRKQILRSISLGLVSTLPISIFGIISLAKGSYFLPNSVLIKSTGVPMNISSFILFFVHDFWDKIYSPHFFGHDLTIQKFLIIIPLVYIIQYQPVKNSLIYKTELKFIFFLILLHLSFARIDFSYRYEAYLVATVIPILGTIIDLNVPKFKFIWSQIKAVQVIPIFLIIYLTVPFLLRGSAAFDDSIELCKRHYNQNYSLGQFMHKYYDTTALAIYDLGEASYFTSANNLDICGLGNIDVARAMRNGYDNTEFYNDIIKRNNVKIAAIYDFALPTQVLNGWTKIATWHTLNFPLPGYDLQFYAIDSSRISELRNNLQSYEKFLPVGEVPFYY